MKKANKRFFIFLIALFSLMTISSFVLAAPTQSGDFLSGAYNWYKSGGNSYAAAGWTNLLSDIARIINVPFECSPASVPYPYSLFVFGPLNVVE